MKKKTNDEKNERRKIKGIQKGSNHEYTKGTERTGHIKREKKKGKRKERERMKGEKATCKV